MTATRYTRYERETCGESEAGVVIVATAEPLIVVELGS
jgi:hypothetical protein